MNATVLTPSQKAESLVSRIVAKLADGATVYVQNTMRRCKFKVTKKNDVTKNFRVRGSEVQFTLNTREWFPLAKFFEPTDEGQPITIGYAQVVVEE